MFPKKVLLLLSMIVLSVAVLAKEPVYQTRSGVAIKGYDPVAYFTESKPVEGSSEFVHEWRGAKWQFASQKNLDLFKADPEKYAPQYGGYCAYAVAKNSLAKIDPEAWRIIDGKLYLNYSANIQKRWEKDPPGYIAAANENYPKLVDIP
jgi:YHS domain-containing protein